MYFVFICKEEIWKSVTSLLELNFGERLESSKPKKTRILNLYEANFGPA